MYKQIFVPIDSSPCAQSAFGTALELAETQHAALCVCHVVDIKNAPTVFPEPGETTAPWLDSARADGATMLGAALRLAKAHAVPCETILAEGPIATTILEQAAQRSADLIVIGSHGRAGIEHLLLGSVAETVLHKAHVPVIVVHGGTTPGTGSTFRHILVAHDGTSHSERAYETALELAAAYDAGVSVCYVVNLANLAGIVGTAYYAADATLDALDEQGRDALRKSEERAPNVQTHLLRGLPADEILDFAQKLPADLIVMGSHGRSGIARAALGSVAESVTRRAAMPVMIVTDRMTAPAPRTLEPASNLRAL